MVQCILFYAVQCLSFLPLMDTCFQPPCKIKKSGFRCESWITENLELFSLTPMATSHPVPLGSFGVTPLRLTSVPLALPPTIWVPFPPLPPARAVTRPLTTAEPGDTESSTAQSSLAWAEIERTWQADDTWSQDVPSGKTEVTSCRRYSRLMESRAQTRFGPPTDIDL